MVNMKRLMRSVARAVAGPGYQKCSPKQARPRPADPNAQFFNELFTPTFMARYTDFASIADLIAESGFRIEAVGDLSRVDEKTWDAFIARSTRFGSWEAMQQAAFAEWNTKQLAA
jgi:hypothetical protein